MGNLLIQHWRGVAVVAAVLIAFGGGFFVGRKHAPEQPARVEYRDLVVEKTAKAKVAAKTVNRRRETTRETFQPNGAHQVEHTVETTLADSHATTEATTARESVKEMRAESRPLWRASFLAGANLRTLSLAHPPDFVFGAHVERYVGTMLLLNVPIHVGAWGLSSGEAGLSVAGEF